MTEGDLIGRGWAFPGEITPGGTIRLTSGAEEIESAIGLILTTRPGDRLMRPEFGCAVWEQLFAGADAGTLGLVEHAVGEALARWEPRIELEQVRATAGEDGGQIDVAIGYRIKATNDRRNLVHPFYVIPREGAQP